MEVFCTRCLETHGGRRISARDEARRREVQKAAKNFVWERHRRGEFGWTVHGDHPLDVFQEELETVPCHPLATLRTEAWWYRREWLDSWWHVQHTCKSALPAEYR